MAEKIRETEYEKANVNPFNAPTPGESLTSSPEMPHAWERPPQYTEQDEAMEAIYLELTSDEALMPVIQMIDEGIPLDQIAQVVLYRGYTQGKFTPDLMLLLAEPTIYLLIAIADYADIKDYVLYEDEDTDPDAEIHGDDEVPSDWDEEDEEIIERPEPKKESLGKSLLEKVQRELPTKIQEVKERE